MGRNKIISVTPALPPQISGVGDYAYLLSKSLMIQKSINTVFLNHNSTSEKGDWKEFEEIFIDKSSSRKNDLFERIKDSSLVLHYVGYGYSHRGYPFWLLQFIQEWKRRNRDAKLIVVFHEMYASGKIWQSAFWTHYLQKQVATKIFELSNYSITTGQVTHRILSNRDPDKPVYSMPVFSNIGELEKLPDYDERENVFILFGSKEKRSEIFKYFSKSLSRWRRSCGVSKIIEIGPLRKDSMNEFEEIEIEQTGVLDPASISSILAKSRYGLISYPWSLLSKSGIFAAYASHGVTPIVLGDHRLNKESDGLKEGIHFLASYDSELNLSQALSISSHIYKWYQSHNLKNHVALITDLLEKHERSKG